jgi:gluconate 2-dehydrogenase gamma chain
MGDPRHEDGRSPDFVQIDATGDGFSRRELIKGAGALGIAIAIPGGVTKSETTGPTAVPPANEPYTFQSFTPAEAATMSAMVERIIPQDENGPGAIEAGVPRYIDRLLRGDQNERYGPENPNQTLTEAYGAGLKAVDAYAQESHGAVFVKLSPENQDAVLEEMEKNKAHGFTPNSRTFFNLVRAHTMEGMFCDPYYGGNINFVGWDLTNYPGTKLAFSAEEQSFGGKITRVHKGFMDYAVFSGSKEGM